MLKLPLISFVVTSYNYAQFIEKTLESIKHQTYKNFEIIIVDDCSTDNSVEIIEKFIQCNQDYRITMLTHDKNRGQFASMIDGLKAACGTFISFVDSDDILLKEYAETHIKVHMAESVAFTSSQIIEIDENDQIHTTHSISSPQKKIQELQIKNLDELLDIDVENVEYEKLHNKSFGGWYWSPNSSAMYRKSSIDIVQHYKQPEKWNICPDKFLFNFANLIGGSINIYAPLIAYRRHKNNSGACDYVTGDKRYHNDHTTKIHIDKNLQIRPETLKFLLASRNEIIEKFGTRGFLRFILKILF